MKTMNRMLTIATTVLLNINLANAFVSPDKASKLNNELTPFGSERVGNADALPLTSADAHPALPDNRVEPPGHPMGDHVYVGNRCSPLDGVTVHLTGRDTEGDVMRQGVVR